MPLFRAAVAVNPASAVAHNGLGVALARLGHAAPAREHLELALALRRDAATLVNRGRLASATGDLELAVACYREAVERSPGDPAALNGLGVALAAAGRVDEAVERLQAALRLDPGNGDVRHNLERCRRLLGRTPSPTAGVVPSAPPSPR